jgi:hypothetical protein
VWYKLTFILVALLAPVANCLIGKRVTVEKAKDEADRAAVEVGRVYRRREEGVRKGMEDRMRLVEEI